MAKRKKRPGTLRVHEGGLRIRLTRGSLRIQLVSGSAPPRPAEAIVTEEDTHLILSAPAALPSEAEAPIRVMTALLTARPVQPGSVIVRGDAPPYRFLAVVHDVDQSPTWRPEWIAAALERVLREAGARTVRTLALPVLGARHGGMRPVHFAALLRAALGSLDASPLEVIWLLLPPTAPLERRALARALTGSAPPGPPNGGALR